MTALDIRPVAGAIGAEIAGLDLSAELDGATVEALRAAFRDHLVLFFRGQDLSPARHSAFAALFGEVDREPFVYPLVMPHAEGHPEVLHVIKEAEDGGINFGGLWHYDVTYRERPHLGSVIQAREIPPAGGDTMWANQYLAYETLSEGMRILLGRLRAIHSNTLTYGGDEARYAPAPGATTGKRAAPPAERIETAHPAVRSHPESGRKALFVNRVFTERFEGMSLEESKPLLEFLWDHAVRPEFTCRWRWRTGDVAVWDNRCTQHFALNDYYGRRREVHRVAIHGERPV
jgi:taurine dioxygenase